MLLKNRSIKKIHASAVKAGIVVSRFNNQITDKQLQSALSALSACEIKKKNIEIVSVAGSIEIPLALLRLAKRKKYDCLVALGCVIRGETPHFDYVCKMAQEGALKVSLENNIPIGFGVLTVNNIKQAKARVDIGRDAAMAAVELAGLK